MWTIARISVAIPNRETVSNLAKATLRTWIFLQTISLYPLHASTDMREQMTHMSRQPHGLMQYTVARNGDQSLLCFSDA